MPTIRVSIDVKASPAACFDLARDVEAHLESTHGTNERAIAGVTTGLLKLGDQVTWRARHFGVTQNFTSEIVSFDRPHHFRDEMRHGVFQHFVHDHYFEPTASGTRMVDLVDFRSPLGVLGAIADRLVLTSYLRRFLEVRAHALKQMAEFGGR